MRKSIELKIVLEVEGDAPAASDFAQTTIAAVRAALVADCLHDPSLHVSVKRIEENEEEDDSQTILPPPDKPAKGPRRAK